MGWIVTVLNKYLKSSVDSIYPDVFINNSFFVHLFVRPTI